MSDNACNEIIALSDRRKELSLTAVMAMGYTQFERTLDFKRLTPDEAADYLWHRFVEPLSLKVTSSRRPFVGLSTTHHRRLSLRSSRYFRN
jgi:hypothetical protein